MIIYNQNVYKVAKTKPKCNDCKRLGWVKNPAIQITKIITILSKRKKKL